MKSSPVVSENEISQSTPGQRCLDIALILAIFSLYAASPPPDVNEAHYLAKARHFWNPSWLRGDLFLESGNAHWLFYASIGWLTKFVDLPMTAWIGRVIGWGLLALGWESLVDAVGLTRRLKIMSTVLLLAMIQVANLSGEWLVGGIEAKVLAYGLVFLALSQGLIGRWYRVWPLLGLAIGFHPLVGGWSLIALAVVRWVDNRSVAPSRREFIGLAIGLLIAMVCGILPVILMGGAADSATTALAAHVYVRERVSHHLYFWDFSRAKLLGFGLLSAAWWQLARSHLPTTCVESDFKNQNSISTGDFRGRGEEGPSKLLKLDVFAGMSLAFVVGGIVLSSLAEFDASRDWANLLLRLYWFRLADVAVPCAVAIGVSAKFQGLGDVLTGPNRVGELNWKRKVVRRNVLAGTTLAAAAIVCLYDVRERWVDGRPGADRQSLPTYPNSRIRTWETYRNWRRVCDWVRENTPAQARFLAPRQQQTFKWYAQRSDQVNWKDIPQDADLVHWKRLMDGVYGPDWIEIQLPWIDRRIWPVWLVNQRADFVVMEQWLWDELVSSGETPALERIYPPNPAERSTYVVLRVRTDELPTTD